MLTESTSGEKYCDKALFAMLGREHADRLLCRPDHCLVLTTGSEVINRSALSSSKSSSSNCETISNSQNFYLIKIITCITETNCLFAVVAGLDMVKY